jgi:hypothetical protein
MNPIKTVRNETLKARSVARITLGVLWGVLLTLYVAAKVDFFVHYDPSSVGAYLQKHSIYWLGMAAVSFLIWLIEKRLPQSRP